MKFIRRYDLSTETRMEIAFQAHFGKGIYGSITRLANIYHVSRTFIYQQLAILQFFLLVEFSDLPVPLVPLSFNEQFLDRLIVLLRLEGRCSLQQISNILLALGLSPHSIGTISEHLKSLAQKLPSCLTSETIQLVIFLSDELFANGQPILITIEPKSTAILRIELADDRSAESWQGHWQEIERNRFCVIGLVSDLGKGLVKGFSDFKPECSHGSDLFHGLRDLSHVILVELERCAYATMAEEYRCWDVLDSARSENVINKRIEAYDQAAAVSRQAINDYDQAVTLFRQLQKAFDVFDRQGQLKNQQTVRETIEKILERLSQLEVKSLQQSVTDFKEHLAMILSYFERASQVVRQLSEQIPDNEILNALCLAWQWNHKSYQAKNAKQNKHCQNERDFWLIYAAERLGAEFEPIQQQAFDQLETIVRSSSLVEMVNSLIRPYLNTCKGQITQEILNLIMFYHNHRQYQRGKRKNKAPIEILTGMPLKQHWLDILLAA